MSWMNAGPLAQPDTEILRFPAMEYTTGIKHDSIVSVYRDKATMAM